MVIIPEIVAGIAKTCHPVGLKKELENNIAYVKGSKQFEGSKKALIIGSSSGFGLATRIALAFGGAKADTIGISFESGFSGKRTGTAGWYNNVFFKEIAEKEGLIAKNFVGDAFSDEMKQEVVDYIKSEFGKVDLVIYSLASGRRKDPKNGITYSSVLKAIGEPFVAQTIDIAKDVLVSKEIPVANEEEIEATVKVMGGEDWNYWIDALVENDCLEKGAKTVAYSYIGFSKTNEIYKHGTIGRAKRHLEDTALDLDKMMKEKLGGQAFVSVNKALVTKASNHIPTFTKYASILYKVMKEKGNHEDCIMQMQRMFADKIYSGNLEFDGESRLRMDDWEMKDEIQEEVDKIWSVTTDDNFIEVSDYKGYKEDYWKANGFGIEDVDYEENIDEEWLKNMKY